MYVREEDHLGIMRMQVDHPTSRKSSPKAQSGSWSIRALMYSNMLSRIMLLTPVRIRMMEMPLYMLDLATAREASPISFVLPSKTLCARVLRVSRGYV